MLKQDEHKPKMKVENPSKGFQHGNHRLRSLIGLDRRRIYKPVAGMSKSGPPSLKKLFRRGCFLFHGLPGDISSAAADNEVRIASNGFYWQKSVPRPLLNGVFPLEAFLPINLKLNFGTSTFKSSRS
jgi:hypothetical protein